MSKILYDLFLKLYQAGIRISAKKGNKAAKWIEGRKYIFEKLQEALPEGEKRVWIHCASLGEFEQGRPIIEELKRENDKLKIVLTFFSPSGYEIRKDYAYADYVFYLPMDGKSSAEHFIRLINPCLVIFVKYEFWYYYLRELCNKNIPTLLIAATFRESQPFFKWYGGLFREMLSFYKKIFVQDERSKMLLSQIGINQHVAVAGDTRYDRVAEIALQTKDFPAINEFKGDKKILIAGSSWKDDEILLKSCINYLPDDWKLIIAPHEIHEEHLKDIEQLFDGVIVRYSSIVDNGSENKMTAKVLVIDNIGMLSSLYKYGDIAFIGGGFIKGGIHNVLEPAAFGLPVLFGPNYQKFIEAEEMVALELAFPIDDATTLKAKLMELISSASYRQGLKEQIIHFMKERQGATEKIVVEINRLFS